MGRLTIAEGFRAIVQRIDRSSDLSDVLSDCSRAMGFRYFALAHHVDFASSPATGIRLHNYPADWQHWFDARRLGRVDPIHRASHVASFGFNWSLVPRMIELTQGDREVLREARRFWRRTRSWPVRPTESETPWRSARTRSSSSPLPISVPTPSGVETSAADQSAPMLVHAVLQACLSHSVGAGQAIQLKRSASGQDQPVPGEEHAILPEGLLGIIFADQPAALGDEKVAARNAVIDVLGHLRGDGAIEDQRSVAARLPSW